MAHIYHASYFRIDWLCDNTFVVCNKVNDLIECCSLNFFVLKVTEWIHSKIEQNAALINLLKKKLFPFIWWCIWKQVQNEQNLNKWKQAILATVGLFNRPDLHHWLTNTFHLSRMLKCWCLKIWNWKINNGNWTE